MRTPTHKEWLEVHKFDFQKCQSKIAKCVVRAKNKADNASEAWYLSTGIITPDGQMTREEVERARPWRHGVANCLNYGAGSVQISVWKAETPYVRYYAEAGFWFDHDSHPYTEMHEVLHTPEKGTINESEWVKEIARRVSPILIGMEANRLGVFIKT